MNECYRLAHDLILCESSVMGLLHHFDDLLKDVAVISLEHELAS